MQQPFLTAHWRNLINLTYRVPPSLLKKYVPKGVTLDVQAGDAFVSLVAFEFLNTKVKGVKIPFHVNFPEINLRFYVKYKGENAVCFIREYVPKYCIALIANKLYNEPYRAIDMTCATQTNSKHIQVIHELQCQNQNFSLQLTAQNAPYTPPIHSTEHYFKEHDLGLGIDRKGRTLSYQVEHPVWEIYPVESYNLQIDFGVLYGQAWAFLNEAKPFNVLFAKGSDIAVFPPKK